MDRHRQGHTGRQTHAHTHTQARAACFVWLHWSPLHSLTACCAAPQMAMQFEDNFDYADVYDLIRGVIENEEVRVLHARSRICVVCCHPSSLFIVLCCFVLPDSCHPHFLIVFPLTSLLTSLPPSSSTPSPTQLVDYKIHIAESPQFYAVRCANLTSYSAITTDVIRRWSYPLVPDMFAPHHAAAYACKRRNIYLQPSCFLGRSGQTNGKRRKGGKGKEKIGREVEVERSRAGEVERG